MREEWRGEERGERGKEEMVHTNHKWPYRIYTCVVETSGGSS